MIGHELGYGPMLGTHFERYLKQSQSRLGEGELALNEMALLLIAV
jgi:hypothetical protein